MSTNALSRVVKICNRPLGHFQGVELLCIDHFCLTRFLVSESASYLSGLSQRLMQSPRGSNWDQGVRDTLL